MILRSIVLSLLFTSSAAMCAAQTSSDFGNGVNDNVGVSEHALFSGGVVDSVQMDSGNLHIAIPLWEVKGRGGLSSWVTLFYDNKGWSYQSELIDHGPNANPRYVTAYYVRPAPGSHMQWSIGTPDGYTSVTQSGTISCGSGGSQDITASTTLIEPDGTGHHFEPHATVANSCPTTFYNFGPSFADDGSGWMGTARKDGLHVSPPALIQDWGAGAPMNGSITDRNGNQITFTASNTTHTDTMGRVTSNALTYHDSSGAPQTVTISYMNVVVSTNLCGNRGTYLPDHQCSEYSATWSLPHIISLPNGTAYTINYNQNGLGDPSSLTLPSGATIDYQWISTIADGWLDGSGRRVDERDVHVGTSTYTWRYDYSQASQIVITNPEGNDVAYNCSTNPPATLNVLTLSECNPTDIKYYQGRYTGGVVAKEIQRAYWPWLFGNLQVFGAQRLVASDTTLLNGVPASRTDYDYDSRAIQQTANGVSGYITWGNIIDRREFLYSNGSWSLARRTHTTYKHLDDPTNYGSRNLANLPSSVTVYDGGTAGAAGPLTNNYSGGNMIAQTLYGYDEYSTTPLVSTAGSPAPGHDYTGHSASMPYRGNLTSVRKWRNTDGGYSTTAYAYNDLGDRLSATDPLGNVTTYSYADNWSGSGCVGSNTQAYVTTIANALQQATQSAYYPCSGLLQGVRDPNDIQNGRQGTQYSYDAQGWPKETTYPDGGNTSINYNGYTVPFVVTKTVAASPDPAIVSETHYDDLGRVLRTINTSDPTGAIYTDNSYDGEDHLLSQSNPYRSTSDATYGVTTYLYDALGRVVKKTNPDKSYKMWCYENLAIYTPNNCSANLSSQQNSPWADYSDETARHWQRISDAYGRLTAVMEPGATPTPSLETDYQYNLLNKLTRVDQWGGAHGTTGDRIRTSVYDSLGRLTNVCNPESIASGSMCSASGPWSDIYTYDAGSNLHTRTDARIGTDGKNGIATTYSYDALNRITTKVYTNDPQNTSGVAYFYDLQIQGWGWGSNPNPQTNMIGRLADVSVGAPNDAWIVYGYDPMGRVTLKSECLPGDCGYNHDDMRYQYDSAGSMIFYDRGTDFGRNTSNPNQGYYYGGFHIGYDGSGHITSETADTTDTNHPAQILANGVYTAFGDLTTAAMTGDYLQARSYDNRGRYTSLFVEDTATQPIWNTTTGYYTDGSVKSSTDTWNGSWTYLYGNSNRLAQALGPSFTLAYTYDNWSNRTSQKITSGSGTAPQWTLSPTLNNRVTGWLYDGAGNVLKDDSHTYAYDAENRVHSVDGVTTYAYDGENNRIAVLNNGSVQTRSLYDFQGRLMTELAPNFKATRANIYVGKELFAEDAPDPYRTSTSTATLLRITDQIGTLRSRWDIGANWVGACSSLPYGDAMNCTVSPSDMLFTGKERDAESSLDYFGARYYNSTRGRWMSPDWSAKPEAIPYASLTNPQSLNLYGYALGSPLGRADKDGHCDWCYSLAAAVASYVVAHPDLGDAFGKLDSSFVAKAAVGVGFKVDAGPIKGDLSASGYLSSTPNGAGAGVQGTLSGRVGSVGGEGTLQLPVVKDGDIVNPLKNATASGTPTVSGGDVAGSGVVTSQETSVGGAYGEGLTVGLEFSAGTQEVKDVLSTLGNDVIFDARQFYQDWLESKSCSYSGCFAPQITPGSK